MWYPYFLLCSLFPICSHCWAGAGQRLPENALERPRRGNIHVSHCGVFFFHLLSLLTSRWSEHGKWKKFFFIFALLSPSGPQQNEKVGAKTTFLSFLCSHGGAARNEKKKVMNSAVIPAAAFFFNPIVLDHDQQPGWDWKWKKFFFFVCILIIPASPPAEWKN